MGSGPAALLELLPNRLPLSEPGCLAKNGLAMTRVPLFPLNLVLFPGQTVPLHIFEERYKEMLQRCLRNQEPFGIVLVKDGGRLASRTPHSIGTLARITSVEEVPAGRCTVPAPHKDNCYTITCRGEERFRVTAIDRREASYLVADVELYPDEPAPPPALLMVSQRVATLFDEYYREIVALMGGWQREATPGERTLIFDMPTLELGQARLQREGEAVRTIPVPALPEDPTALANIIATELNVQPSVKQDLLEAPSALARLQREAEILAEETPQMEERLKMHYRRRFGEFGRAN
jgi:Lon protease-like protein